MIQISNSIEIVRPPEQVFAFVADVTNNPQWMPVRGVQKLSNGMAGVGMKFKQQFFFMGANYELLGVLTAFDPHQKIAFVYDSPVFNWRGDYLFEPTVGGTLMSAKGNVTLLGPMKMMETM